MNDYFKIPRNMIRMICKDYSHALLLEGRGGIGKTYNVTQVLNNEGLKEGIDYIVLRGYSTPLQFYNLLYENKDMKIIVLDDIEGVFTDKKAKSILKNALDTNKRIVEYHSTTPMTSPDSFELNASIIVCCNLFPRDLDFLAVKDRCFCYKFNLSNRDVLDLISGIVPNEYKTSTLQDREEVFSWLNINIKEYYENFSIRTYTKSIDAYLYDKTSWKEMILSGLCIDKVIKLVFDLEDKYDLVKDMYEEFRISTSKSYRTFIRLRKELGLAKYRKGLK